MVMPLEIFGFLKFSVTDMLDVLLVALLIYFIFRWIRDSAAMNIFTAIISIYVLRVIADALKMKLVSALLGTFIDVGVLAVIIIFQPEIRHFLMKFGSSSRFGAGARNFLNKFLGNEAKPLDSGAVIIDNHHSVAARCTLPITERTDIPAKYGMRHKAAIGITEETDADVIVVSEETGGIAFGHGGTLTEINNINELKLKLGASLSSGQEEKQ